MVTRHQLYHCAKAPLVKEIKKVAKKNYFKCHLALERSLILQTTYDAIYKKCYSYSSVNLIISNVKACSDNVKGQNLLLLTFSACGTGTPAKRGKQ